jgi:hypothetical protein
VGERSNESNGDFATTKNAVSSCAITEHRAWAVFRIALGIVVFAFARQISALKSRAWARFYRRHPGAAETNPLSVHAGTERSIRLGAVMWRIVGAAIVLNGVIRL